MHPEAEFMHPEAEFMRPGGGPLACGTSGVRDPWSAGPLECGTHGVRDPWSGMIFRRPTPPLGHGPA